LHGIGRKRNFETNGSDPIPAFFSDFSKDAFPCLYSFGCFKWNILLREMFKIGIEFLLGGVGRCSAYDGKSGREFLPPTVTDRGGAFLKVVLALLADGFDMILLLVD